MLYKRGFSIVDGLMIAGLILVAFIIINSSGIIKKDCGIDEVCFKQAMKECKSASLLAYKNNNVYSYKVLPSFGKQCKIEITLQRSAAGSSLQFDKLVEHKSMECKLPRDNINEDILDDFSGIINYCSGPLKEGLYELIIQRMYTLIIKELSNVQDTKKEVLKQF